MKNLIILLILSVVILSCKKEDDLSEDQDLIIKQKANNDGEFAQYNFGDRLSANFIGRVLDEQGIPLNQVQISIGNNIAYTDHNGVFILNSTSVFDKFAYIKAAKSGYINASRTLVPTSEESNDVQIILLERNIVGTVNSGEVSEVSLDNGTKVSFGGGFIDAFGNPYSGQVEVSVHYLEPNQKTTFEQMPGMLFGQREDGSATVMETYGMLAVELYSASGELLNISEDSPAKLFFPISTTTPNAEGFIPLWFFDEEVGYWKEQGVATKVADEYIAEVTHFTWWNCDLPIDGVNVCFELKKDIELSDLYFEITNSVNGQLVFSGITNRVGKECGLFPKGVGLSIDVYSDCDGEVIHSQNIGPFSNEAFVNIKIPSLSSEIKQTTLTGIANSCNGNPITNGYLYFYQSDNIDYRDIEVISVTDGIINVPFTYCESQTYNLVVFDIDTKEFSEKITELALLEGETSLGNLSTCEGSVGGVFNGNVTLFTQEEVNQFGLFGYNEINGDLTIYGGTETQISSLSALTNLNSVTGSFEIDSTNLKGLEGLSNLSSIGGGVIILKNARLLNLKGLENITDLSGDLRIDSNQQLVSLDGLNNILSIAGLTIHDNASLQSLNKLEHLNSLGGFLISNNDKLINLEGLNRITSIGSISIVNNISLRSLYGLDNLNSIGKRMGIWGNEKLENINALSNLKVLNGSLGINNNSLLTSLSPLESASGSLSFLNIKNNKVLTNLDGLNNLAQQLNGVTISGNDALENIDGLVNVTSIDYYGIIIENNKKLNSIEPLTNLITVKGAVVIRDNPMITKIGLKSLSSITSPFECSVQGNFYNEMYTGSLIIQNNDAVTSLEGLENLTIAKGFLSISDNDSLVSLNGLDNLYDLAFLIPRYCLGYKLDYPSFSLEIKNNSQLEDFCALKKLFETGYLLSNDKVIINLNKYNPTISSILTEDCKL